jgi:hypothetical protein
VTDLPMTPEQRAAIRKVFERAPIYDTKEDAFAGKAVSFEEFISQAQPELGGYGAVILPWAGMFLCIEKDGYTHS